MTRIPPTSFYDSPFLDEVRNNGAKAGMKWLKEEVINAIWESKMDDSYIEYVENIVSRINTDNFFPKKDE